jgi:hypothetical protein
MVGQLAAEGVDHSCVVGMCVGVDSAEDFRDRALVAHSLLVPPSSFSYGGQQASGRGRTRQ